MAHKILKRLGNATKVGIGHRHIESLSDNIRYDIIVKGTVADSVWQAHVDYVRQNFDRVTNESSYGFDVMRRNGKQ